MKLIHIRSCTRRVFALNSKLCMKTVFFFKLLIGLKSSGCNWIYCRNTASRSARYRVRHPTMNSATAHPAANASGYLQRPKLFQNWTTKRCYHQVNIHHFHRVLMKRAQCNTKYTSRTCFQWSLLRPIVTENHGTSKTSQSKACSIFGC